MLLRRHRKEAGGEDYEYWSLVKTIRTARGPRHQIVARLGGSGRAVGKFDAERPIIVDARTGVGTVVERDRCARGEGGTVAPVWAGLFGLGGVAAIRSSSCGGAADASGPEGDRMGRG